MKQNVKTNIDNIFTKAAKHPYIVTAAFCVLLFFFGLCEKSGLNRDSYYYAFAVIAASVMGFFVMSGMFKRLWIMLTAYVAAMALCAGGLFLIYSRDNSTVLMLVLSLVFIAGLAVTLRVYDALTVRNFIILMFAAGVILRFVYILYTTSSDRQHDVGYFNFTWGHANYIEYWYKNGLKLPDFDVREIWQYYHPPLHHWLMALLLKLLTLAGVGYDAACQALQVLPFIYSSLCMAVSYRLFRWVKLKGAPLIIASAIVCFHPTFVIMAGSFNNDMLAVLFSLLAILFALRWYREPTLKRIIPVALCIGLGMMTKLSVWMVAPAVAVIFLYVFIKNIRHWTHYIGQFAVFGVICVPLGLWWQVRNLLAFGVPLTYVPRLAESGPQYFGGMSAAERLLDLGHGQLSYPYFAYTAFGAPYDEFNPTVGLIKSALFDEGNNNISEINYPQTELVAHILLWVGIALAALCLVCFICSMLSKKTVSDGAQRLFFGVIALTMLGSYYMFCFQYPFTCTMNVRYCVPLITLFAMGLGLALQRLSGDTAVHRTVRYAAYALTAGFCAASCTLFALVGS